MLTCKLIKAIFLMDKNDYLKGHDQKKIEHYCIIPIYVYYYECTTVYIYNINYTII